MTEYKCRQCKRVFHTSGKLISICPACNSVQVDKVKEVDETGKTINRKENNK